MVKIFDGLAKVHIVTEPIRTAILWLAQRTRLYYGGGRFVPRWDLSLDPNSPRAALATL